MTAIAGAFQCQKGTVVWDFDFVVRNVIISLTRKTFCILKNNYDNSHKVSTIFQELPNAALVLASNSRQSFNNVQTERMT